MCAKPRASCKRPDMYSVIFKMRELREMGLWCRDRTSSGTDQEIGSEDRCASLYDGEMQLAQALPTQPLLVILLR